MGRLLHSLLEKEALRRLGLCALAAVIIWAVTGAWSPHLGYRTGYVPQRNITARVNFSEPDPNETAARLRQRRSEALCVYQNDVRPLVELKQALKDKVFAVLRAGSYEKVDKELWRQFFPLAPAQPDEALAAYQEFVEALSLDRDLAHFSKALDAALADYEKRGLLANLEHKREEGSQLAIMVHPVGNEKMLSREEVKNVRIAEATAALEEQLEEEFHAVDIPPQYSANLAARIYSWLRTAEIPATLTLNAPLSEAARALEEAKVEPAMINYPPGATLAQAGRPLRREDIALIAREHRELVSRASWSQPLFRSLAMFGMYIALAILCGYYIYYHNTELLKTDFSRFTKLLACAVAAVILCWFSSFDQWRAELIPLLLFGMTVTVAFTRELALLLSACLALVVTISLNQGIVEFVVLVATSAACIQSIGRIRSRTKLIYAGMWTAVVALFTTLGVGTLAGQPLLVDPLHQPALIPTGMNSLPFGMVAPLVSLALWYAFCALLASLLMTGLLPFVERLFDIQTDISLLELGDAAHPLLQQLVRLAPGTYNHSINVASISEAAAEAIGANGLLCRVAAYFHDIGKMLKPSYFIENQGGGANRHDSLVPAMSTLVIIAHVKDGVELAKEHGLPKSIIDFIEQHHGTTLVEFFYRQANQQSKENPDASEVEENDFRYPGPKPQTREAGVMMLADAVESASRTLVDPAPARIENLVHEITMKRLLDEQFSECNLTLQELSIIEESLVKSLTAVYHGRVKYPSQQSA